VKGLFDLMVKIKKYGILSFSPSNLMIRSLNTMPLDRGGQELQNEYQYVEIRTKNGGEIRVTKKGGFGHFNFFGTSRIFCFRFFSAVSHSTLTIYGMIMKPLIPSIHWYKEQ
jgi:hypothetical protein